MFIIIIIIIVIIMSMRRNRCAANLHAEILDFGGFDSGKDS